MTTDVAAGRSAGDINGVADPAWLARIRSEVNNAPILDADGAVVIRVSSGSGVPLSSAPDRTIKLPDLGAHQPRVMLAIGASTLQRVVVDPNERLEELILDGTGRIARRA